MRALLASINSDGVKLIWQGLRPSCLQEAPATRTVTRTITAKPWQQFPPPPHPEECLDDPLCSSLNALAWGDHTAGYWNTLNPNHTNHCNTGHWNTLHTNPTRGTQELPGTNNMVTQLHDETVSSESDLSDSNLELVPIPDTWLARCQSGNHGCLEPSGGLALGQKLPWTERGGVNKGGVKIPGRCARRRDHGTESSLWSLMRKRSTLSLSDPDIYR